MAFNINFTPVPETMQFRFFMEKSLFSSLHYFSVVKVVMHFIFQEEKTVDERDPDRTTAKKYVSSVIFCL